MQDDANAPQTPPPLANGVGQTLKAAREKTGKSIAEVATQLRIRQPFLAALEGSRHKDLPGGTYAVGFLRTYAEFLGLDGEEMVRRFRSEAAGDLNSRSELIFPSPVSEGRIPGGAVLFLGIVLAGIGYGSWHWLSARDSSVAELVPALPDRLSSVLNRQATLTGEAAKPAEALPKITEPAAAAAPPAAIKEEMVPPAEDDDKHPEPAKAAPGKPEPVKAEPVKAEPVKAEPRPEAAKAIGQEHTDSRITLTAAADDCWVQVREIDGQLLLSRLLRKGESYMVPNRPGLTLMVGNAGALDITVDGKKSQSLGTSGQVRRDIKLDVDKLMAGG
jgi:cytoskeleton protein RodZ